MTYGDLLYDMSRIRYFTSEFNDKIGLLLISGYSNKFNIEHIYRSSHKKMNLESIILQSINSNKSKIVNIGDKIPERFICSNPIDTYRKLLEIYRIKFKIGIKEYNLRFDLINKL